MSMPFKIFLGICALVATFFMFAPEERTNGAIEAMQATLGNEGIACLNYHRKSLKDADSARLLTTTLEKEDGPSLQIAIKYKAKNSYGAYGESEAVCWLENGVVKDGNL